MKRVRVKMTDTAANMIGDALDDAIERGMNRHDKYSESLLSDNSRYLLRREVVASFWLALEDRAITLTR